MGGAEALQNVVKAPIDLTKGLVQGTVDVGQNVAHKTADIGQQGVGMAVDTTGDTINAVKSPLDNFLDQITTCFGLFGN